MKDTIPDRLRTLAVRWIKRGWQEGDPNVVDELHAAHFVDHDPAGRASDREGFRDGIRRLYAAFPDFRAVVEDVMVEAATGKVAIRWSATGTHRGAFLDVPPTGKRIAFKGIEIVRFEGERIVERWGEWDGLSLLDQLGRSGAQMETQKH